MSNLKFQELFSDNIVSGQPSGAPTASRQGMRLSAALLERLLSLQISVDDVVVTDRSTRLGPVISQGGASGQVSSEISILEATFPSMESKSVSSHKGLAKRALQDGSSLYFGAASNLSIKTPRGASLPLDVERECPATPKRKMITRVLPLNCPGAPRKVRRVLHFDDRDDTTSARRKLDMLWAI